MTIVVKIGTTSVTGSDGLVDVDAIGKLAREIGELWRSGRPAVVVTSGAVSAGIAATRPPGGRPADTATLQALSTIGQHRLMRVYDDAFAAEGLFVAQVLLSFSDFGARRQYLHARETITRLIAFGAVPVINENDAVADDEIRFGDNDRLAALIANLVGAECLVLLTDTEGLFDADPRRFADATLVEQVVAVDAAFDEVAGGPGSAVGSGGMASKLAAARMAAWCGVRAVIAGASRPGVVVGAADGAAGVGTTILPRAERLPARKAWIAFALPAAGRVVVDDGCRRALVEQEASLLPAGVVAVIAPFGCDDAIEIASADGSVIAKGISRLPSDRAGEWLGHRLADLPADLAGELVHRDDLVVLSGAAPARRSRSPRRSAPR
ncbi:MAG: glutamate 5-kinase [Acidimicrobiales bacterium]|jgi:glutamate 5-kinase